MAHITDVLKKPKKTKKSLTEKKHLIILYLMVIYQNVS